MGDEAAPKMVKWLQLRELPRCWWWEKPKVQKAITEIPEAVDGGIPEAPTTLSGKCLGGRLHADA